MPDAFRQRQIQKTDQYVTQNLATVQQSAPQQQTSEDPVPDANSSSSGPNPYEEKFHSELCFISLILGIFGLVLPLFSTLAIIVGIGGLMQANRERMKGKWMGVLGIILGFVGIFIIVYAIVFGIEFLESYLAKWGGIETLMGEAGKLV